MIFYIFVVGWCLGEGGCDSDGVGGDEGVCYILKIGKLGLEKGMGFFEVI